METKQIIAPMIESVATDLGFDLVEFDLFQAGQRTILRIYIDKDDGIVVDDCQNMSRELSTLFDLEDPLEVAYTLEVSSPGVDRPLKKDRDFERNMGRHLKVSTSEDIDGKKLWIGKLLTVDENTIKLEVKKKTLSIPRSLILLAKVEIIF
jgi:ribosome maturation factor RimP